MIIKWDMQRRLLDSHSQGYKYNSTVNRITSVIVEYLEFANLIAY